MSDTPSPSASAGVPARRTRLFALGALAVAGVAFGIITFGGIGKNLVYYWGPKDIRDAGEKAVGATIRLGGLVAPGSIVYAEGTSHLEFDVTDGHAQVHVKSKGVPPQMFRERIGVVVEGTMTHAGWFESQRLMVSHNNEYKAPKDGEKGEGLDVKELMRSLQEAESKGGEKPPAGMGGSR
jgi:cytochrome c-type biogenesis protein CcmE